MFRLAKLGIIVGYLVSAVLMVAWPVSLCWWRTTGYWWLAWLFWWWLYVATSTAIHSNALCWLERQHLRQYGEAS